jgi:hypothetical protein
MKLGTVCGKPLTIAAMGGGKPTDYVCSDPGNLWTGGDIAIKHYRDSRWVQQRSGDPAVLRLIAEYRTLMRAVL